MKFQLWQLVVAILGGIIITQAVQNFPQTTVAPVIVVDTQTIFEDDGSYEFFTLIEKPDGIQEEFKVENSIGHLNKQGVYADLVDAQRNGYCLSAKFAGISLPSLLLRNVIGAEQVPCPPPPPYNGSFIPLRE